MSETVTDPPVIDLSGAPAAPAGTATTAAAIPAQRAPEPTQTTVVGMPLAANGVPTSVFGFAIVVLMLSLANAGVIASGTMFVPVALTIGVFAIGIGGLYELRNGDIFGGTFGVVYASFLLATGVVLRFFAPAADADAATVAAFGEEVGAFFLLAALLSAVFAFAAKMVNLTAILAFALLAVVFVLAGFANIVGGDTGATLTELAGYVGIADGLVAFYLATGILLNTMSAKDMMPLGAPKS